MIRYKAEQYGTKQQAKAAGAAYAAERTAEKSVGVPVMVRLQPDLLAMLDVACRATLSARPATRPEMIRRILWEALKP